MFLHLFHNICLWTQSGHIENQHVVSENRNAQILIDLFEYDAK